MDKAAIDRTFAPAARDALKSFPVDAGELALVSMAENVTFKVTDRRDGRAYVLRLHRPGYHTLDELDSEQAWMRALADAGIDVPRAVSAHDGRGYVPVTIEATGERRFAGLARWTEGRLLSDVLAETGDQAVVEDSFSQLGALTATMHNQASAWQPIDHSRGFVQQRQQNIALVVGLRIRHRNTTRGQVFHQVQVKRQLRVV